MDYQIDKSLISEVTLEGQAEKRPAMADRLYSNTHVVDTTEEKARERTEAYLPCSWDRVQGLRREKGGQSSSSIIWYQGLCLVSRCSLTRVDSRIPGSRWYGSGTCKVEEIACRLGENWESLNLGSWECNGLHSNSRIMGNAERATQITRATW